MEVGFVELRFGSRTGCFEPNKKHTQNVPEDTSCASITVFPKTEAILLKFRQGTFWGTSPHQSFLAIFRSCSILGVMKTQLWDPTPTNFAQTRSSTSVQPPGIPPHPSADLSSPDPSEQSIGTASDTSATHLAGLWGLVLTSHVEGGGGERKKREGKKLATHGKYRCCGETWDGE